MVSKDILKIVYFASFHTVMVYVIMFWGNSTESKKIFRIQKKAVQIICNKYMRDLCRYIFVKEEILTLTN